MPANSFPPQLQAVFDEFVPIFQRLAGDQRYAIAVSGSLGKGTWDSRSDVDFRLYTERALPYSWDDPALWADALAAIQRWRERGVIVDDVWPRAIGEIDAMIERWTSGEGQPAPMMWTIWGYYILPDMFHQHIIDDPYQVIAGWKQRLSVYPPALKQAVLKKYLGSLSYWRADYHYANKVERGDAVFLAGLSSRLVHEILQIVFALNETYFVGDGSNLTFVKKFQALPPDFANRVESILYPQHPGAYRKQYAALTALIDDVVALARQASS